METTALPPPTYVPVRPLELPPGEALHAAAPPIATGRPIELAALVGLVALCDVTLYAGVGGAGLATLFLGSAGLLLVAAEVRRRSLRGALIATLLALVAGRCLWQASAGAALAGAVLLLAFAIALRTARTFVPELVVSSLGSAFGSFRELWNFGASGVRYARPSRLARVRWAALLVPLALVALFGGIFVAANPLMQKWALVLLNGAPSLAWFPSPLRFIFWGACALAGAGLLRPVCRELAGLEARLGPGDALVATEETATAARLAIARNVMIALNALFLAYNALDAVYLWAGRAPSGVSHTDYAHGGAAWLTVALVLSTIVLGALFRGAIQHDPRAKLAHALAYAWAGQNFVLAAGTFRRITMYVAYSGLTELRMIGICGTALVTAGLAIVVAKVLRRRTMLWMLRRQLDAFALALALFVVAPTSYLAMRYNVSRVAVAQYRPLLHLFQQPITAEAIPEMLPLLDHEDPVVREGAAALLLERGATLERERALSASWTQWEVARGRALRALEANAAKMNAIVATSEERTRARAKLRGVAYGINDEEEREGDDGPFDFRSRSYAPREQ